MKSTLLAVCLLGVTSALALSDSQDSQGSQKKRQSATPNLDDLARRNIAVKRTAVFQATDPQGKAAFQLDYTMEIYPKQYYENKYSFVTPSGEAYVLRVQQEQDSHVGKTVLQLPDHSTITLQFSDHKDATLTYAKSSVPVDLSTSHGSQFKTGPIQALRDSLPASGKVLAELTSHLRGELCREASLCGGTADFLLDLFREDADVAADVDSETKDDSGWKLKTLSERKETAPLQVKD